MGTPSEATLCPKCGTRGKALSYCKLCGEFIPMQIEVTLPDSCTASEAQLLIDRHTVAQLEDAASTVVQGEQVRPATALPWKISGTGYLCSRQAHRVVIDAVITSLGLKQDTRYIVHACNAYPKLVEALRKARETFHNNGMVMRFETEDLLRELGEQL